MILLKKWLTENSLGKKSIHNLNTKTQEGNLDSGLAKPLTYNKGNRNKH